MSVAGLGLGGRISNVKNLVDVLVNLFKLCSQVCSTAMRAAVNSILLAVLATHSVGCIFIATSAKIDFSATTALKRRNAIFVCHALSCVRHKRCHAS